MKKLVAIAITAFLAAPALAQTTPLPATIQAMIDKGVTLDVQGMPIDVQYKADGTFTAMGGQAAGTWKLDGKKLCITVPGMVDNQCTEYPEGKKAGDVFEITNDQGTMTVTINK